MLASGVSPRRTTDSTKPWSITAGTAGKPIVRATICTRRANAAGMSAIVGGTKTATAGIPIAIGMTTITIATNSAYLSTRPDSFGALFFFGVESHRYSDARFHCWRYL
jgi:hypothetical protein